MFLIDECARPVCQSEEATAMGPQFTGRAAARAAMPKIARAARPGHEPVQMSAPGLCGSFGALSSAVNISSNRKSITSRRRPAAN